jgi:hypothetical protein
MTMSWNETTLHHRPFKSGTERICTLLRMTYTATVADVRRFPGSRKYPYFKREYGKACFRRQYWRCTTRWKTIGD